MMARHGMCQVGAAACTSAGDDGGRRCRPLCSAIASRAREKALQSTAVQNQSRIRARGSYLRQQLHRLPLVSNQPQAIRLGGGRGQLGHEPVGGHPDRNSQAQLSQHCKRGDGRTFGLGAAGAAAGVPWLSRSRCGRSAPCAALSLKMSPGLLAASNA